MLNLQSDGSLYLLEDERELASLLWNYNCIGNYANRIKGHMRRQRPTESSSDSNQSEPETPGEFLDSLVDCHRFPYIVSCEEVLWILATNVHPLQIGLSAEDFFARFIAPRKESVARTAIYFRFRSNGWIAKRGLKFGCDFVLYEKSPEVCHSSFCVYSVTDRSSFDWPEILAAVRSSRQVRKRTLFALIDSLVIDRITTCATLIDGAQQAISEQFSFSRWNANEKHKVI